MTANVAVPFGEAPAAAALSRCALVFGACVSTREQARAARGDLPQEVTAALARYEVATVVPAERAGSPGLAARGRHAEQAHAEAVRVVISTGVAAQHGRSGLCVTATGSKPWDARG